MLMQMFNEASEPYRGRATRAPVHGVTFLRERNREMASGGGAIEVEGDDSPRRTGGHAVGAIFALDPGLSFGWAGALQ